jgi:hypothetical protein
MRSFLILALLLLGACARSERVTSHADWMKEATRIWPGETRARVIAAAEAVLKQADPRDTKFEYNQRGFLAKRAFFIYAVIASAEGVDTWSFTTAENSEGASASVRVIQRGKAIAGQHSERFRDNQTMVGSFRLFWARIDYMLGQQPDWVTCAEAPAKLDLPPAAPGLEGLCSLTHQGRNEPPPPKLGTAKALPKATPKGPPAPPPIEVENDS